MLVFCELSHHAAEGWVVDLRLFSLRGFTNDTIDQSLPNSLVDVLEDSRVENLLELFDSDVAFIIFVKKLEG